MLGVQVPPPFQRMLPSERNKGDRQCSRREASVSVCEPDTNQILQPPQPQPGPRSPPLTAVTANPTTSCPPRFRLPTTTVAAHNQHRHRKAVATLPRNAVPRGSTRKTHRERHKSKVRSAQCPHQDHVCGDGSPCVYLHPACKDVHTKFIVLGEYGTKLTALFTTTGDSLPRPRCNTSHEWFHAVDTSSYIHCDWGVQDGGDDGTDNTMWPSCRNPTCGYYYRGYQKYCSNASRPEVSIAWDALDYAVLDGEGE